jgi:hypothetical protein
VILIALVYLFAMWNASRAHTVAQELSETSAAAMQAYGERLWERPWSDAAARDCNAVQTFVDASAGTEAPDGLDRMREHLLAGEALTNVDPASGTRVANAAREARACSHTRPVDRMTLDETQLFDWRRHLDLATILGVWAAHSPPDACLEYGVLLAESAVDASTAAGLVGLEHSSLELRMAAEVVERCAGEASDRALDEAASRLRALLGADAPYWRSLELQALLVEAGASNAARGIRTAPADPVEFKHAVFTGVVFDSWERAIAFRERLDDAVEADGPAGAAQIFTETFEERDDRFEHIIAVRPSEFIEAHQRARKRLEQAATLTGELHAHRAYETALGSDALELFRQRYTSQ